MLPSGSGLGQLELGIPRLQAWGGINAQPVTVSVNVTDVAADPEPVPTGAINFGDCSDIIGTSCWGDEDSCEQTTYRPDWDKITLDAVAACASIVLPAAAPSVAAAVPAHRYTLIPADSAAAEGPFISANLGDERRIVYARTSDGEFKFSRSWETVPASTAPDSDIVMVQIREAACGLGCFCAGEYRLI